MECGHDNRGIYISCQALVSLATNMQYSLCYTAAKRSIPLHASAGDLIVRPMPSREAPKASEGRKTFPLTVAFLDIITCHHVHQSACACSQPFIFPSLRPRKSRIVERQQHPRCGPGRRNRSRPPSSRSRCSSTSYPSRIQAPTSAAIPIRPE